MRRLLTLWWLLNMPCREAAQLVSESLDRKLTRAERLAVRLHLLYCVACRRYRRQVFLLKSALRRPADDGSQPREPLAIAELDPEVRERIKRRLREP
jgi:predicted anti-sigma-YlaC factor YlaD